MKLFWTILKYFGYVTGALGTVTVTVLFFDGMKDDIVEIKDDVEMMSIEQSWIAEDIVGIRDTLAEYEKEHKKQGQDIETLTWGLEQHENFTPEQFEEIMDELLKKNYSLSPSPSSEIPFGMTTTGTGNQKLNSSQ